LFLGSAPPGLPPPLLHPGQLLGDDGAASRDPAPWSQPASRALAPFRVPPAAPPLPRRVAPFTGETPPPHVFARYDAAGLMVEMTMNRALASLMRVSLDVLEHLVIHGGEVRALWPGDFVRMAGELGRALLAHAPSSVHHHVRMLARSSLPPVLLGLPGAAAPLLPVGLDAVSPQRNENFTTWSATAVFRYMYADDGSLAGFETFVLNPTPEAETVAFSEGAAPLYGAVLPLAREALSREVAARLGAAHPVRAPAPVEVAGGEQTPPLALPAGHGVEEYAADRAASVGAVLVGAGHAASPRHASSTTPRSSTTHGTTSTSVVDDEEEDAADAAGGAGVAPSPAAGGSGAPAVGKWLRETAAESFVRRLWRSLEGRLGAEGAAAPDAGGPAVADSVTAWSQAPPRLALAAEVLEGPAGELTLLAHDVQTQTRLFPVARLLRQSHLLQALAQAGAGAGAH
jgi:hypothetical protein